MDSSEEEDKDEEALLWLMALNNDIDKIFDLNLSCTSDGDDDIDDIYSWVVWFTS